MLYRAACMHVETVTRRDILNALYLQKCPCAGHDRKCTAAQKKKKQKNRWLTGKPHPSPLHPWSGPLVIPYIATYHGAYARLLVDPDYTRTGHTQRETERERALLHTPEKTVAVFSPSSLLRLLFWKQRRRLPIRRLHENKRAERNSPCLGVGDGKCTKL